MPAQALVGALIAQGTITAYAGVALFVAAAFDAFILGQILAPSDIAADLGRQNLNIKTAAAPHKVIYGRTMTGGTVVLLDVLDRFYLAKYRANEIREHRDSGTYLNMAIAVASHEIDAIEQIWVGEDKVFEIDYLTGNTRLVNTKYKNYIEYIGEPGNQTTSDAFIKANVDRHYEGRNSSNATYEAYYKPHGVTDVSGGDITIDNDLVFDTVSLVAYSFSSYNRHNGYTDVSGTYGASGGGTIGLRKTGRNGRAEPVEGRGWDTNSTLTNSAYIYLRFRYNPELYNGIPKVRAVIRGKKVYDPRWDTNNITVSNEGTWVQNRAYIVNDKVVAGGISFICQIAHTSVNEVYGESAYITDWIENGYWHKEQVSNDPATWQWSANWALCCRDYLTSGNYYDVEANAGYTRAVNLYGVGVKQSEIDDDNIIEAANISDETVYLQPAPLTVTAYSFSTGYSVQTVEVAGNQLGYYNVGSSLVVTNISLSFAHWLAVRRILMYTPEVTGSGMEIGALSEVPFTVIKAWYVAGTDRTHLQFPASQNYAPTAVQLRSNRFSTNGIVDTSVAPIDNLEQMLGAGAGKLPYVQGKFLLIPGVYIVPTISIDESILAGPLSVRGSLPTNELINTVVGTLKNPGDYWEEINFPPQWSQTYIDDDGGYELIQNVKYSFTTSIFDAQRLARIALQRSREGVSCTLICTLAAMEIVVGQFITVSLDRLGWVSKVFSVTSWTFENNTIHLGLREENSVAYDWDDVNLTAIEYAPDTDLVTLPELSPVTSLAAVSGTNQLVQLADGTIVPRVKVTWIAEEQDVNTYLELRYQLAPFAGIGLDDSTELKVVRIDDPEINEYYIEGVREGDLLSIDISIFYDDPNIILESDATSILEHQVIGQSQVPADVTGLGNAIREDMIVLFWNANSEIDFSHYEIRIGGTNWGDATAFDTTTSLEYIVTGHSIGSLTYRIKAVDNTGNESTTEVNTTTSIAAPSAVSAINNTILATTINLYWAEVTSTFALAGYQLKYDGADWDSATQLATLKSTNYTIPVDWLGSRTIRIKPFDIYNNFGTETTTALIITAPSIPTLVSTDIVADRVEILWHDDNNTGTFEIASYDIRYDTGTGTFDNATHIIVTSTDGFSRRVDWLGNRRYWIAPIDTLGNYGAELTTSLSITAPGIFSITPQVIDNNVLLSWAEPAIHTLPISYYEIRKGVTYGASTLIGNINGIFSVLFETVKGAYTYWITAVDTVGNVGTNNSTTVLVNAPPDYALLISYDDDFTGTFVNASLNSVGRILLPVDTTQTWATHYTGNSWTTPQAQIDAGFPMYIQPTPDDGSYQFVYDYGSVITNLSITCNVTEVSLAGDATHVLSIETTDETTPTTWVTYPTTSTDTIVIFAPSFRHVRVTFDADSSPADTDVIEISNINLTIDVKELTDGDNASLAPVTGTNDTLDATGVTLHDTTGTFLTDATVGQTVRNTTDVSNAIITSITDDTHLVMSAGLAGGSDNQWQASDSYSLGTAVNFNKTFVDISSLIITPKGTTNKTAVYDFVDEGNPTRFYVYMFDDTGTELTTGDFSWLARGY